MSSAKRKRNVLTITTKLEIIDRLAKGESGSSLAKLYDVGRATITDIKNQKGEIFQYAAKFDSENGSNSKRRKSMKGASDAGLEDAVFDWWTHVRGSGVPLSGPLLCEKALQLNKEMGGNPHFKASKGWLKAFKSRHGIRGLHGYKVTAKEDLNSAGNDSQELPGPSSELSTGTYQRQPIYLPEVYDLKLVTEVEKNPMLYDLNDPSFRNKELSVSKWNEMGELLGITAERARARWTTLKACYSRSLTLSHNFYLSEPMAFLLPHMNIEKPASELPTEKSYTDQTSVEIKSEPDSDVDSSPGDMSEANMTSPANETCSRAAESTTVDAAEGSEDLEMKVEEIHEFPLTTTTSFRYHVPGHGPSTSRCHGSELCPPISNQQQRMPVSKRGKANPGKKLAPTRADNPSASGVKEQSRGESTTSSSEDHTSESDLEYFKGLLSLIKQLSAKRKRQLFGTFAAELFRHLDEQEND